MTQYRPGCTDARLPLLPTALLRSLLPLAERDEVLADLGADYRSRRAGHGGLAAGIWLWRQVLASLPSLFGRSWWRGWSGFEPSANRMRPGGPPMESWIIDLRYAVRRLANRPLYALLAVLTLALGVGGTAAVFSLVRGLLLEPLPYADEEQIAVFWNQFDWSEAEYLYFNRTFPGFSIVSPYRDEALTLERPNSPTRLLSAISASAELFTVLGVGPAIGRGFKAGDDLTGAAPVAVLSDGLWRDLGGDPGLVGQTIRLDGTERTIVGVMPPGFWFPDPTVNLWVPEALDPETRSGNYALIGRFSPGMTIAGMDGPLAQITARLDEQFDYSPQWDKTKNAKLTPVREYLIGSLRPALVATAVAMALILLIACANVAALMLGQVDGRSAELAVRSALGADRRRLTEQLVVEALVVGVAAGAVGAVLAAVGYDLLVGALPLGAWAESSKLDWTLFAAAIAIAILAALGVALVPTLALWRGDLRGALTRMRTTSAGGRGSRMEGALVVAEVALAVLLAAGAGLLIRSVGKLYAIDPGFNTRGVAVFDVALGATTTPPERREVLERALNALRELPGVEQASLTQRLPLRGGGDNWGVAIQGRPDIGRSTTAVRLVGPEYFDVIGARLRSGRTFTIDDRAGTGDVTVVNKAFAEKYYPGEDPLGRIIGAGNVFEERIVGVIDNIAEDALLDDPAPARYYVYHQAPTYTPENQTLVVRTERPQDAAGILDAGRRAINRVAPGMAIREVTTMEQVFGLAVGPARQLMSLLTILTGLALILGAIGVYGVISHFVQRRKRDWGIRLALGLTPGKVISHVVGRGVALVLFGVALGLVGVMVLSRFLVSFLFGIGSADPAALAGSAAALLAVGVIAAFLPAWRASRVDPATVLREQ